MLGLRLTSMTTAFPYCPAASSFRNQYATAARCNSVLPQVRWLGRLARFGHGGVQLQGLLQLRWPPQLQLPCTAVA